MGKEKRKKPCNARLFDLVEIRGVEPLYKTQKAFYL
jgi:hypothetical protein